MAQEDEARANGLTNSSRRSFLRATATTGAVAGLGGVAAAQEDDDGEGEDVKQRIELVGKVSGWVGKYPPEIEGQTNPTLDLKAGTTYDITWTNGDGLPHDIVITGEDGLGGKHYVDTDIVSEQGASQSVSVVAETGMTDYYCSVHANTMHGAINIQGAEDKQPTPDQEQPMPGQYVPKGPTIGLKKMASEPLHNPINFASPTGDDRKFIVDQVGIIYAMDDQGDLESFMNIKDRMINIGNDYDERGLLGLDFHPNFTENRKFYVRYSAPLREDMPDDYSHTWVLSEFKASENFEKGLPESETILMELAEPQSNHNAGSISFGPDGYLYTAAGDGGAAGDTGLGHVDDWYDANKGGNAQDVTTNMLGSLFRIDVDGQQCIRGKMRPYAIPDDNPLVGKEGFDEQYSWGWRNPWRMSFNDGELWMPDVGQNLFEEVNIVEKGGNYGWNVREGYHCFSTEHPNEPADKCPTHTPEDVRGGEPLLDPILEYPHQYQETTIGITVIGGFVYDNDTLPELTNRYVFGDWGQAFTKPSGRLWLADKDAKESTKDVFHKDSPPEEAQWPMKELVIAGSENGRFNRTVLAFGRDHQGELYVLGSDTSVVSGTGYVYKIVPPEEGDTIPMPDQGEKDDETSEGDGMNDGDSENGGSKNGSSECD